MAFLQAKNGEPTERQIARAQRSRGQLEERQVPAYWHPMFVADDEAVVLQPADEVASRTLVLWAVVLRGEGVAQKECQRVIDSRGLWKSITTKERLFLCDPDPTVAEREEYVWRLESLWVMLWALNYVTTLTWPAQMCSGEEVGSILSQCEGDSDFISEARLRDKADLLDAQDVTMKIHWAVRNALLHGDGMIPINLDWRPGNKFVSATECHAANIVFQRHWSLNWLVNAFSPANWDSVETHT